jgi:predicted ATPase/class 3 adenylate cyclase
MDVNHSFGYWIRRRRKALDLTQTELAQRVGCAMVTIKKIEADERRPSRQMAERLADLLDIPPTERTAFLMAARAELAADRLTDPVRSGASLLRAPAELPSGTITFLFTDIQDSTQLWEQHRVAMGRALARHDAILRRAIAAYGGRVFKTVGDAVCAAFARAPDALAAALACQRELISEPWSAAGLPNEHPLRVRMALHTGTVAAEAGDYLGPPLNRVARLLAAGHGGQVLLSRATWELVRDELPQGIELRDLGERRLKDLTRPEHIFQLIAPDLPAPAAALNTLDSQTTNLPVQTTALVGREREVSAACELLRRGDVRLLTLIGPGGIGKTRLGLQVAAELLDEFADGVFFVPLAALREHALLLPTIAQTLGVHAAGGQSLEASLESHLRDKQLLLLLDNFEQIADAAPALGALLRAAPALKALVTSRAPLRLSGEQEYVVPPLALPARKRLPPLAVLSQYDAVALFIARAQAARPDFHATDANAPAIAEICHRLDGLPLAIELAAARVRLFAPPALLARLDRRLALLTGGARDLPERQRTLRSAIDWSYQLLDDAEQTLFRRLAVFVGGCCLEAAEAVCGAEEAQATLDLLAKLVDQSLLQQTEILDDEPRFVLLETIREYALEQLAASGEAAALHERHADYFLAFAEHSEPELQSAEQRAWLERLEQEHDNMRAALDWALNTGAAGIALRLSGALARFWWMRNHAAEGRRWLNAALAAGADGMPAARAKALHMAGMLAHQQGEHARANVQYAASLALRRELADDRGVAYVLNSLGGLALEQGDYARASALLEESLAIKRTLGSEIAISASLNNLTFLALALGDLDRAQAYADECLAIDRALGHEYGVAMSLGGLGAIALAQGDQTDAQRHFVESLALFCELRDQEGIADGLEGLAGAAVLEGRAERAAQLFGAAEALREEIGVPILASQRATYERQVAEMRLLEEEAILVAAWAAGRAMSLEQATAVALDQDSPMSSVPSAERS